MKKGEASSSKLSERRLKLGLGTVQLGMDYGITNRAGRIPKMEACCILARAAMHGVDLLDTAAAYGNSEEVIGYCLSNLFDSHNAAEHFEIFSKTPVKLRNYPMKNLPEVIREAAMRSCQKLGVKHLNGYLVHDVDDLLSSSGNIIWKTLCQLREEGTVGKIGFSAYEAHEIDELLEKFTPDVVQIPFNAVDRRLVDSGALRTLRQAGVEIHARSIFLQGVLLLPVERLTGFFAPLIPAIQTLEEIFHQAGLSRLAGLLAIAWQSGQIDRLIVGVASLQEMDEMLQAAASAETAPFLVQPDSPLVTDERILNPSLWPLEARSLS